MELRELIHKDGGTGDGSVIKSPLLLLQRTQVQIPALTSGGSQLLVTPAPGHLRPVSGLCGHYTHLYNPAHPHKNKTQLKKFKAGLGGVHL